MPSKEAQYVDFSEYLGLVTPPSGVHLPKGASPNLDNVEWFEGYARRARGLKSFSSAMAGNPRLFKEYITLAGARSLLGI